MAVMAVASGAPLAPARANQAVLPRRASCRRESSPSRALRPAASASPAPQAQSLDSELPRQDRRLSGGQQSVGTPLDTKRQHPPLEPGRYPRWPNEEVAVPVKVPVPAEAALVSGSVFTVQRPVS
jgi:hypothetical protein